MKMNLLTITKHIKIIKIYYKNGDAATSTYRTLKGDYGPTTQAIGKIVKIFKETAVVTNIERPVHYRFGRSAKNIAVVSESVAENPNVSIPRRSPGIELSYGT